MDRPKNPGPGTGMHPPSAEEHSRNRGRHPLPGHALHGRDSGWASLPGYPRGQRRKVGRGVGDGTNGRVRGVLLRPSPTPHPLLPPAASARGRPGAGRVPIAATCPRQPLAGPRPERPSPDPEMWTRSRRPRLEHDDRSLCGRPRGWVPGSLRRAGAGGPAGVSEARRLLRPPPARLGSPRELRGAPARLGHRLPAAQARGGAGAADHATRRAATQAATRARKAGRRARRSWWGAGGRKRTESLHRKSRLQPALTPAGAKATGLGAGPPSVPANLPAAPPPGRGHGPLQIGGRVPSVIPSWQASDEWSQGARSWDARSRLTILFSWGVGVGGWDPGSGAGLQGIPSTHLSAL